MRLNKLIINNFRSYEKETEFIFKGTNDINIIIGENGTGKTSFLSAIKYVLFGSRTFGSEYYTKDYVNWATNELNFNSDSNQFSITLQFVDKGSLIDVKRSSIVSVDDYEEKLELFINGKRQLNTKYLENLNYNLYNNIFFNGEKIGEVTSSERELRKFTENMIDVYFELGTFKQIIKDTQSAINKEVKKVSTDQYKSIQSELTHVDKKVDQYQTSVKNLTNEIAETDSKIKQIKSSMEKHHMLNSASEKAQQQKLDEAKANFIKLEDGLRKFLQREANILLTKSLLKNCSEELNATRDERVKELIKQYNQLTSNLSKVEKTANISINLEKKILQMNDFSQNYNLEKAEKLFNAISSVKSQVTRASNLLEKSEDGKKLLSFDANLEFLQAKSKSLKEKLLGIEIKLEQALINREELIGKLDIESKTMLSDTLAANAILEKEKLIKVCETYLVNKRRDVFNQVAGHMETILKEDLLRKKNLVDSVIIDDYNLNIISDGKIRAISSFSAGEQQMFLIGLIFSILDQAHVEVPLILDTFFARIDGTQQENLIKYIDAKLNNQALFISTDSELTVDKQMMFKNVNKKYMLFNDGYKTRVEEAYENKNK